MNFLGIGPLEILVVLAVALIAFGPNRLPELARHVAKAMKMFREASNELQKQLDMADWDKPSPSKSSHSYTPSDSTYGETSYDSETSYASGDLEGESSTGATDSQTDDYSYPYGGEEETAQETPSPSKPEAIDDPDKTDDAQRYAREMTD